jgi:hypothetical protein
MTLHVIRSPRGFAIIPVHWSHDPTKTDDWADAKRAGYATQGDWDKEMEIDFSSVAGKPCYSAFNPELHVKPCEIQQSLPVCLAVDFNVAPMVWIYGQIVNGQPRVCGEIRRTPATVEDCVTEFRNAFPAHPAGVRVYGDSAGNGRTSQTGRSDYDMMRLAFRGYPSPVEYRVPLKNPGIRDRVNAVNRKLKGADGKILTLIDPSCRELIADFNEVVWNDKETEIRKVYAERDPYSQRTHASDCFGYWVFREWPIIAEVAALNSRPAKPIEYKRVLGEI